MMKCAQLQNVDAACFTALSGGFCELGFRDFEGPIQPGRQCLNVARLDRRTGPDAQSGRVHRGTNRCHAPHLRARATQR